MINDAIGTKCIIDGHIKNIKHLSNVGIDVNGAVYEVIRIIDGALLFWKDHMERMQNSVDLLGWHEFELDSLKIEEYIKTLNGQNDYVNCNVKIIYYALPDENKYIIYIPKTSYPDAKVYEDGVSLSSLKLLRANPHAKRMSDDYKGKVSKLINSKGVFEALLVNDESKVTEGSKSNIFFIKDCVVYTPHKDMVLEGITRKHVIDVCKSLDIHVKETCVDINDISKYDAVFLSGTSIHVLPVSLIDENRYDSSNNDCLGKIRKAFSEMVVQHINS